MPNRLADESPPSLAEQHILTAVLQGVIPAVQVAVRWRGETMWSRAYGWLDPETKQRPTQPDTLFDLASVTKLFVATAFVRLVEAGRVTLETPVCAVLPEFSGARTIQPYEDPLNSGQFITVAEGGTVDAGAITFRRLLTHTSGLPAWRPLFRQASAEAARQMALSTPFACPPDTCVVYSDIGLILLGLSLERLTGLALDEAVRAQVTEPLGLAHTHYRPLAPAPGAPPSPGSRFSRSGPGDAKGVGGAKRVAPTEFCLWRNRRLVGEVHDENAAHLGGVAGHAGLFSTADDVARFGQTFLDAGLLRPGTIAEMTREQARDGNTRRGLGFSLWSPDPEASCHPFGPRAFGHTGFTGTSLWVDPERELVVALLTNDVYHGREGRSIDSFRARVHRAIVEAL